MEKYVGDMSDLHSPGATLVACKLYLTALVDSWREIYIGDVIKLLIHIWHGIPLQQLVFLCLQNPGRKFCPKASVAVNALEAKCKNMAVTCSISGKLTSSLF